MIPRIIAWCGSEQMHISWFLWCSHTGEKLRGLNWEFVSWPVSHWVMSWSKVMGCGGWSCFWDALFPCSGLTKAANDCHCAEPCVRCSAPLPPGARAITPSQLHPWLCMCKGMGWLLKNCFPPERCQALGKGCSHMEISSGLPAGPLWIEADTAPWAHTERGHPSFCGKQQNDNSLVS